MMFLEPLFVFLRGRLSQSFRYRASETWPIILCSIPLIKVVLELQLQANAIGAEDRAYRGTNVVKCKMALRYSERHFDS